MKRIRRFPYPRSSLPTEPSHSPYEHQRISPPSLSVSHSQPGRGKYLHFIDEDNPNSQDHLIILFSKVMELNKNWFTVKLARFKSHYQINLISYPNSRVEHSLILPQLVGTALLSQTDYDYFYIIQNCIKFTSQFICISFELG